MSDSSDGRDIGLTPKEIEARKALEGTPLDQQWDLYQKEQGINNPESEGPTP
jgi:hypothetical protein